MKSKPNLLRDLGTGEDARNMMRQKAQEIVKETSNRNSKNPEEMSLDEIQRTLFELQIHQIELEMQNEELRRAYLELDASRARYFELYDLAPVGYLTLCEKGLIVETNLTAAALLGISRNVMIGKPISKFILTEDSDIYYLHRKQLIETGEQQKFELRLIKEDGSIFWGLLSNIMAEDADGSPLSRIVINDVTERKTLERELSMKTHYMETTLRSVGDGVISTDKAGTIVFMNETAELLTGWTNETALRKPIQTVYKIVDSETENTSENRAIKAIKNGVLQESPRQITLISREGLETPVEDSAAPIIGVSGEILGAVLVFRDFTEKKRKQEEVLYLSYHDHLTGLYNRRFYEEELLRLDTKRNLPITLVMGDVNGLKLINDSFGHGTGDALLQKVASIITNACRGDDIITRVGGDEFMIILPKTDVAEAEHIVQRIKDLSSKEKVESINISISLGYDTKHKEEEDINDLFKRVEDKMYLSKLYESSNTRSKTIDLIMNTLYAKYRGERAHSKKVSRLCEAMAVQLALDKESINQIKLAGLMHDIGIIGIDENILKSSKRLNATDWNEIKRHSEIGYRALSSANEFAEIANYVLEHQERWDGKGYPKGLKGEEISLQARIIAVADAFDTMTRKKPYRIAKTEEEAIQEIKKYAGTQFDPEIAKLFCDNYTKGTKR